MRLTRATAPTSAAERLATVTLQPRHWRPDAALPPFRVTPPARGGWSVERACKVARTYATAHGLCRAGALRALRAIEEHGAPGLGVAYQRDRWARGRDLLDHSA